MYLNSSKVKVFPSAYREKVTIDGVEKSFNPESRLNAEVNFVNIINTLSDKDVFVVSYNNTTTTAAILILSIKGYWFRLELNESNFSSNEIWATIKISNKNASYDPSTNTDYPATSLCKVETTATIGSSLDVVNGSNGEFRGLSLDSGQQSGTGYYSYKILVKDTSTTPNKYKIAPGLLLKLGSSKVSDEDVTKAINEIFRTGDLIIKGDGNIIYGEGSNLITSVTGVTNATITLNGNIAEADYYKGAGKRAYKRISYTSSTTSLDFSSATENIYTKVLVSESSGTLSLTFEQ